ncbi:hypothetical protein CAOG_009440 [Capsaspora owczarzaki ATCC 30864]|uniref:Uncharacterized protein n=1 Tax=Capsaspora owczarzaki (strain ATCC 30864) TaxID=595528 RepID=A0A0D2WJJ1_CAPO3|nr:hypothetical protein CAOG_009440 [Capsaspora owczarzaki ATCC 30864]
MRNVTNKVGGVDCAQKLLHSRGDVRGGLLELGGRCDGIQELVDAVAARQRVLVGGGSGGELLLLGCADEVPLFEPLVLGELAIGHVGEPARKQRVLGVGNRCLGHRAQVSHRGAGLVLDIALWCVGLVQGIQNAVAVGKIGSKAALLGSRALVQMRSKLLGRDRRLLFRWLSSDDRRSSSSSGSVGASLVGVQIVEGIRVGHRERLGAKQVIPTCKGTRPLLRLVRGATHFTRHRKRKVVQVGRSQVGDGFLSSGHACRGRLRGGLAES